MIKYIECQKCKHMAAPPICKQCQECKKQEKKNPTNFEQRAGLI